MSWFGNKTYNVLGTAVQTLNLMEPSTLLQDSTINAIQRKLPLAQTLINDYVGGGKGYGAFKYYNFGKSKFTNGLVEGTLGTVAIPYEAIQKIVKEEVAVPDDQEIKIGMPSYGSVDYDVLALEYIKAIYPTWLPPDQSSTTTGNIDLIGDAPRGYYAYGEAEVKEVTSKQICYFKICNIQRDAQYQHTAHGDKLLGYTSSRVDYLSYDFELPSDYKYKDDTDIRYQCPYQLGNDDIGWTDHVWEYFTSENTHPELDPSIVSKPDNQHMPVVPIRLDNRSMVSGDGVKDTPLFKTSRTMLDMLQINIDQMAKAIDENEDVSQIDHAYFVVAPKLTNTAESTSEYLFRYFQDLYAKEYIDSYDNYHNWEIANADVTSNSSPGGGITLHDKESHYMVDFSFDYIRRQEIKGNLVKRKYDHKRIADGKMLVVQYQQEPDLVIQYTIANMDFKQLLWKAWGDKGSPWSVADFMADEDDNNFLIPINISIVREMDMVSADRFIQDSCSLVIQSWEVQQQEVKWYQRGFFQFFLKIATLVITVVTFAPTGGASASWGAWAMAALTAVTVNVTISFVFQLVADWVGVEIAAVLLVVAVAAGYSSFNMIASPDLLMHLATDFVMVVNNVTKNINRDVQRMGKSLEQQQTIFEAEVEEKDKILSAAQEDLSKGRSFDPMSLGLTIDQNMQEGPDAWMNRKTMDNPGYMAIDAVYNYVDIALTPTLDLWRI